jgi:hypothetical protein
MSRQVCALAAVTAAALVGAGAALAAGAPAASTGPVSSVGATTATVSGSVNPNGISTSWYVEYGTSTSYGKQTSSTNIGSGTTATSISGSLSGLTPGTTYHYRVVATNSAGTNHGNDGILTTVAAPQAVTAGVSNVTPSSATLNGSVNPSSRATTWYFEYGTSTSYGTKTPSKDAGSGTSTVSVSAGIGGLTAGRTYHYRLVATSDAGTSRGSDQSFTAAGAPAVTTKSASSVKDSTVTFNASVNPNGQTTNVYFEYGTTTGYGSKTSTKSAGSGRGATNVAIGWSGLAPGVTYHLRAVASNSSGTNTGTDVTFTTTGPSLVHSAPATGINSNGATLTGTVDPNGHTTNWYFQWGSGTTYGKLTTSHALSSSGSHTVSETIGGLAPGTTYHFRLVGTNSFGATYGTDVAFTTAGAAVTIAPSSGTAIARHAVTLAGKVASGHANESVAVYAQRFGGGSFVSVATVLTDAAGRWSLVVHPPIGTAYKSIWNGSTSNVATVAVRPGVTIRALSRHRISTHVVGARSFAGRTVQLQRHLLSGRWVTIAHVRLNRSSSAIFKPALKRGRSTLRIAISVNQAGAGYLAGFSTWITVKRP